VNVRQRAEKLVDVEFHLEDGHNGLHLVEVARGAVDGLGDKFEYEVKVNFVLLRLKRLATWAAQWRLLADTYPLAIVVEEGLELHNVWVSDDAHDLQLTVLLRVSDA
jgi:hypothetical protein